MNECSRNVSLKENLYAFFLAFIIMFGFPFNMYVMYFVAVIWAYIIRIHNGSSISRCESHIYILACGVVWTISCLYCNNVEFALKYIFLFFSAFLVVINTSIDVYRRMLIYLLVLGGMHVFFILVDFFNHDLVMSVASRFLNAEHIEINNRLRMYSGACSGLTGQTGQAALFVVLFMYAVVSFSVNRKVIILLLAPAVIALLLTQKRSFLGFGLLFSIGYLLFNFKNLSKWSKVFMVVLACATYMAMQYYIDTYFDVSAVIDKIEEGSMSNRDVLWKKMIKLFDNNLFFGIGLYSTDKIFGMTGHNIYLQLLCENGLLGAPVFLLCL